MVFGVMAASISSSSKFKVSVLITGAAKRIGRQMALDLADDGWDVAVHCNHSKVEAEEVAALIRAKGRKACVVQGDLADADIATRLIAKSVAGIGPLTALINNASIFEIDGVGAVFFLDAHCVVRVLQEVDDALSNVVDSLESH